MLAMKRAKITVHPACKFDDQAIARDVCTELHDRESIFPSNPEIKGREDNRISLLPSTIPDLKLTALSTFATSCKCVTFEPIQKSCQESLLIKTCTLKKDLNF